VLVLFSAILFSIPGMDIWANKSGDYTKTMLGKSRAGFVPPQAETIFHNKTTSRGDKKCCTDTDQQHIYSNSNSNSTETA
jgi:hypothetical protein